MNHLNHAYWSDRYSVNQVGWDIGACSTPLQTYFDQLKDKSLEILIPGAGFGHEAIYLHSLGFNSVIVVDIVQEPLDHLLLSCPSFPKTHLLRENFFDHQGKYDLIIEQTFFCAIDPSLRCDYVQKMRELLRINGKLVGVLFDRHFDGGPPFGGDCKTYRSLFEPVFNSVSMEPCNNSIEPRKNTELFVQIS